MKKVLGNVSNEELAEIYFIFNKFQSSEFMIANPPNYSEPRVLEAYMGSLMPIKLDFETRMKVWWDKILSQYGIKEDPSVVSVDFRSGELYTGSSEA